MNEEHEELAALSAIEALNEEDQSAFEIEVARDSELESLTLELEDATAALAALAPAVQPPAELKSALMAQVRRKASLKRPGQRALKRTRQLMWVGWGIAAVLAAGAFLLWSERDQLSQQVTAMADVEAEARKQLILVRDERDALEERQAEAAEKVSKLAAELQTSREQSEKLSRELAALHERNALAQVQIATLQSSVEAYQQGVAVVVWDGEKGQGVLKLEKMPPVEAGKDYQLWVVDPKKPAPVDAGVVRVDAAGFAKVDFKPVTEITEATKFALSVEKEGGVPKGEGPIILIGP